MPHALGGNDLIGPSQTGTGRTAAFTLPILHALLECHSKQGYKCAPGACNAERFQALGSGILLVGGVELMQQQIALGKQPHIIVGTPGRLMDHLTNTKGEEAAKGMPEKPCEAAQKYSTVDTLKQHYRFVAAKNKVPESF
ncbi:DEAD-box ATP-dependent RNA helicase 10 -like protein [Gossypium arboreum]|uniref:DEAD-box ATP-dependent RNA helicase 10-like protein n=1 Tax=Gossypium arboreum TaxID=29729 RepID=A0A0B0P9K6_GOSAR|nr:DEAD-box ATP-dependent RNA helicase 10 -like protein [Gossypium arboreum]